MNWDKFWTIAKNIAKTIYILILITLGMKILLFIVLGFIPYKSFYPFEQPDWNPLATIIGSILTGLITWFAVYKTAELDRKARRFENNYKLYQERLLELNNRLLYLRRLNFLFYVKQPFDEFDLSAKLTDINNWGETIKAKKALESINRISPKWKQKENFIEALNLLADIQQYLSSQISQHKHYLSFQDEEYKKDFIKSVNEDFAKYHRQDLVALYNSEPENNMYDGENIENTLDDIQKFIDEEFKLDEK